MITGKAKIVALTQPVIEDIDTPEEFIAFAARVSNPENQANKETAAKLLRYCAAHGHWSVFEMVNVVIEIVTTRDITHQILRHRSFSFQEFSQRYSSGIKFITNREGRLQDNKNRQNSIEHENDDLQKEWEEQQDTVVHVAEQAYQWALSKGIAKECARAVLPEGLTLTTMYMNGYLRNWIHYLKVRQDPSTQKEHRYIADLCYKQLSRYFPNFEKIMEK